MNDFRIYGITSTVMFCCFLLLPHECFAVANCTTPPTCTDNGGNIGSISTFDTSYTSLIMAPSTDFDVWVDYDTSIGRLPHLIWQDVTLGDAGFASNINVRFIGRDLSTLQTNVNRTLEVSKLTLYKTDLDTGVQLSFAGNDNQINLSDSGIYFTNQQPGFISTAPLTINSVSGSNYLKGFHGEYRPASTTINVQSGSTLLFDYSGSLSNTVLNSERLYFATPVTGSVNNGTLSLRYSNVYFNSSSFTFTNNSTLSLSGADTKVEFDNVSFDTSNISLGNNTKLVAGTLTLDDNSSMTINSGARATTQLVEVVGDSTLAGTGTSSGEGLIANSFNLQANNTFSQSGSRVGISSFFYLNSGSVLNVDNSYFSAYQIFGNGGTVNISNGGEFDLTNSFYYTSRQATFNNNATSQLTIGQNADLILGPLLTINNAGALAVSGYLSGEGTISGTGTTTVYETGQISPGLLSWASSADDYIDTITFENAVYFRDSSILLYPHSSYRAHLDVVGGVESNDLLQYVDNDFDMTNLHQIRVDLASTKTADELDGKSFTIIAAQNAGATGNLITGGSYPAIYEGDSIPALIDFTYSNNNSNGHDDVTLNATKQSAATLLNHPGTQTGNNQSGTNLIINAANSGNTAINNTLNTLTNNQASSHFNSIHAEPFSSNMTISLEQNDLILDMALDNASPNTNSYSDGNKVVIDPNTRQRFWVDGSYMKGNIDGQGDLGSFKYSLFSFVVGKDLMQTTESNLGVFGGVGTQKMDEHDLANQDFRATSYHLGIYGYKQLENWHLTMASGYGYGEQRSDRQVQLGTTLSGVNSAKFKSDNFYIGVNGRYKPVITQKWVTISPAISILYNYHSQESISERGVDSLAITVDSANAQSFITGAGLDTAFKPLGRSKNIYPIAFVRYEKDWWAKNEGAHMVSAALSSHPDYRQKFAGQNRGEDIWTAGVGLKSNVSSQWQVSGGFVKGWDSNGNENAFGISAVYEF